MSINFSPAGVFRQQPSYEVRGLVLFVAKNMQTHRVSSFVSAEIRAQFLSELRKQISSRGLGEDVFFTHLLEGLPESEVLRTVNTMIREEVERQTGVAMTQIYDWAFFGSPRHRVYHQDELAYMSPMASCYTAWLLLDRSEISPCAGLNIIPYQRNESLYDDVCRGGDSRATLRNGVPESGFFDSVYHASKSTRFVGWKRRVNRLLKRTFRGQPFIERHEDLMPGDFMLFNTGLFHSSSNPETTGPVGTKIFYKITMIQSDALVSTNPVDDYCPYRSLSALKPGQSFGTFVPPARSLYVGANEI